MAVLKYKLNGKWITLSGGPSGDSVEIDTTLTTEGKAADAKATGEAISVVDAKIAAKQNKIIFNTSQPSNWSNGDIWLKPAE